MAVNTKTIRYPFVILRLLGMLVVLASLFLAIHESDLHSIVTLIPVITGVLTVWQGIEILYLRLEIDEYGILVRRLFRHANHYRYSEMTATIKVASKEKNEKLTIFVDKRRVVAVFGWIEGYTELVNKLRAAGVQITNK